MADDESDILTSGARKVLETAQERAREHGHVQLGTNHLLLALLERHAPMVLDLTKEPVDPDLLKRTKREELRQGNSGTAADEETIIAAAFEHARGAGKAQASERDLAAVVLATAGYTTIKQGEANAAALPEGKSESDAPGYRPRSVMPTPTLDKFGRDLTRDAAAGKLRAVQGRDEEIELIIETLCRQTKRNPVLVGPAGVGKTAIVEGLALRIVRGETPAILRGLRLVALEPSALVAGASMVGEIEKRMTTVIKEASVDGIVLFIDEVHTIIGAGGRPGGGDIASLLKPALARGDLACIAATTDDEYRAFMEEDTALERRFQPVRIQELSPAQTMDVLRGLRDDLQKLRGVSVTDEVLGWLIDFSQRFLRNRFFPDKAIDLLEQSVASALVHGKSGVDYADAQTVVERMIGMPPSPAARHKALRDQLRTRELLSEKDAEALLNRLEVTDRGLDLQSARPNATLLLPAEAAASARELAALLAESLFGNKERVVTIEFGAFMADHDVTMLTGSPRGYVGYGEKLAIHAIAQMPWCVLLCQNVDACNPRVREVLRQALLDGHFTDSRGKRVYLSDTVVVMTASTDSARTLGFHDKETVERDPRAAALERLGESFAAQCDIICGVPKKGGQPAGISLNRQVLAGLSERYRRQGLNLRWDNDVLDWFARQKAQHPSEQEWSRRVDEELGKLLIPYLPEPGANEKSVRLSQCPDGTIRVDPSEPQKDKSLDS